MMGEKVHLASCQVSLPEGRLILPATPVPKTGQEYSVEWEYDLNESIKMCWKRQQQFKEVRKLG